MVKANSKKNMGKLRNIFNWFISLGKPSFRDSIDIANREAWEQWYSKIPRDELNDAIKCLASELSNIEDFDSPTLFFVGCGRCRNRNFCGDIVNSMRKAFTKYAQPEAKGG